MTTVRDELYQLHASVCKGGDPKRLLIIESLRSEEKSVTEICEELDLPQANVSQHLAILREKGLVRARKDGQYAFYSLTSDKITQAVDLLRSVMNENLLNTARMSDETYDRIVGLRVTRRFTDDPIDDSMMTKLLEAARWAGSSKNRQGWAFIVLRGDDLERVAGAGHFTDPLRHADAGIALVRTPSGYDWDLGRAAQNVVLAADTLGLGACPVTLHDDHLARQALGIPQDHDCRYVIALGWPDHEAEALLRETKREQGMAGREPLDEIVHHHRWDG